MGYKIKNMRDNILEIHKYVNNNIKSQDKEYFNILYLRKEELNYYKTDYVLNEEIVNLIDGVLRDIEKILQEKKLNDRRDFILGFSTLDPDIKNIIDANAPPLPPDKKDKPEWFSMF